MSFNPRLRAKVKDIPDFVLDNLDSIRKLRKHCHIPFNSICRELDIKRTTLLEWELGERIPSKFDYNRLAVFFDWEVWE